MFASSTRTFLALACLTFLLGAPRFVSGADSAVAAKAHAVLKKHCYSCHGEQGTIEGGINYILDGRSLVLRGKVIAKNPRKSALLQRIRDGEMPPEDAETKISDAEIAVITDWVAAGAPPFQSASKRTFLSEANIYEFMQADLEKVTTRSRRFIRYFTITHLYNAGMSEDELQTYRNAIFKLVNSLSWNARITVPEAIDPGKTVFRIDLRDFNWNIETWQSLLDAYPYGVELSSEQAKSCYKHSQTTMPRIRGDWFVAHASQPPLYHTILELPMTDAALEKQLRVNVRDNIEQERVIRAGFNSSGVSTNNRLIERHDSPYGAYWKSYDFSSSRGRKNLFAYPLGPYDEEQSFDHAGGEIIFNLPNGLHAFLLTDEAGRRIDKGPTSIVTDPKRPDRTIVNGLSCMTCHSRGLLDKQDQVRMHVTRNPKAFSKSDSELILALYKPREDFTKEFQRDMKRYQRAMEDMGVRLGSTEPIVALALRFESEVDVFTAACEAGISQEQLVKGIQNSAILAKTLGTLNIDGGTVQRDVFVASFRDVVRELKLGTPLITAGEFRRIEKHVGGVNHLEFTRDGRYIASSGADRVRIWDVTTGREVRQLMKHPDPIRRFDISNDGKLIATAGKDGFIRIFEFATGKLLRTLKGHEDIIFDVTFTPDGKRVLSASMDRSVRVWDTATGKLLRTMWGHRSWVRSVDVSADGKFAASTGNGLMVIVWNLKTWQREQYFIAHQATATWVEFVGKTNRIVTSGYDNVARYWNLNLRTERLVRVLKGHTKPVSLVCTTPDNKFAITSSQDGTARMWHLDTGKEVHRFGNESNHTAIAISPDGRILASSDKDGTIHLFGVPKITVDDDGTIRRGANPR